MSTSDCNDDRKPKWQDWRPKRLYCHYRLLIFAVAWKHLHRACRGWKPQICRWNFDPISHSSRDNKYVRFCGHVTISGICRCCHRLWTVFELQVVDNRIRFAVEISMLSVIVLKILAFPVWRSNYYFQLSVGVVHLFVDTFLSLPWSKTLLLPLELQ